ncbi:unnamed protein product [Phytophthora fragariaefolia]|uniref:Unnamed protein product n=1 Tax=Phytophthora fragariaefolia TaxID=1490495 RepID=A0A9W6TX26_9STRA|nr:unnamed protein product [Phytophthora fragariaefolia]
MTEAERCAKKNEWSSLSERRSKPLAGRKCDLARNLSDYRLPFKLTTDAPKTGLGAVLSQDQGNGDQPVAYASKVNSQAVAKYGISELECLAVMWAVRLFRPHLNPGGQRLVTWTSSQGRGWRSREANPDDSLTIGSVEDASCSSNAENLAAAIRQVTVSCDDNKAPSASGKCSSRLQQSVVRITMEEMAEEVAKQSRKQCGVGGGTAADAAEVQIDRAAAAVVQTAVVRRVEAAEMRVVQCTDADIRHDQAKSVMVQTLKQKCSYRDMITAVEYTTRYAVAEAVPEHTAKVIARFLMHKIVLVYGPMMEIMMDGAMEFGCRATEELLELMQTK